MHVTINFIYTYIEREIENVPAIAKNNNLEQTSLRHHQPYKSKIYIDNININNFDDSTKKLYTSL